MINRCAYPDCERPAKYRCVVCGQTFCECHIYERGGYVCTDHFNEPVFEDPHAPQTSAQALFRLIDQIKQWSGRR
jgi:hypothetical protein